MYPLLDIDDIDELRRSRTRSHCPGVRSMYDIEHMPDQSRVELPATPTFETGYGARTSRPKKGRVSPGAPKWFFNSFADADTSNENSQTTQRPNTSPFHSFSPFSSAPTRVSTSPIPPQSAYDPITDNFKAIATDKMVRRFKPPHNYCSAKIQNPQIMRSEYARNIFGLPDYNANAHGDNMHRIFAHERAFALNPHRFRRRCILDEKFAIPPMKPRPNTVPSMSRPRRVHQHGNGDDDIEKKKKKNKKRVNDNASKAISVKEKHLWMTSCAILMHLKNDFSQLIPTCAYFEIDM